MCGRYEFSIAVRELEEIVQKVREKLYRTGEVYPTNRMPVLLKGEEVALYRWGFPAFKGSGVIMNARAETAAHKPTFRSCMEEGRCVVPSSGFFEWDQMKKKYRFRMPEEEALYMAGLAKVCKGLPCYVILTTAANPSVADIHSRMPVVLPREKVRDWLENPGAAEEILAGIPPMLKREAV